MNKFKKFVNKWGADGIQKSLERKRQRKLKSRLMSGGASLSLIDPRFQNCSPLSSFTTPARSRRRINLITDSINEGSLYGGVGTALILAGLICNKHDCDLRIVTRTEKPVGANVKTIFNLYGIVMTGDVEFFYASIHSESRLDITPSDRFITTSWWSTAATIPAVPAEMIYYLLQEDERMFYPFGDERLRCDLVLRNQDIQFIVNTEVLYNHFVADGFSNMARSAKWFHPAFPRDIYYPREKSGKKKMFFYARPGNERNLFHFGVEVLEKALFVGLLDPAEWDILFVGKNIPDFNFKTGIKPQRIEGLSWAGYAALIGRMDLALSLMYTPHPSYPPLDLAASGAVVITNQFANKRDLKFYSENIICAELNVDSLVAAIASGVSMLADKGKIAANHSASQLPSSWNDSFREIVDSFGGWDD